MIPLEFTPVSRQIPSLNDYECDVGFIVYRLHYKPSGYEVHLDFNRYLLPIGFELPLEEAKKVVQDDFEKRMKVAMNFNPIKHPVLGEDIKIKTDCVDDYQQTLNDGFGFGLATAVAWYKENNKTLMEVSEL